MSHDPSPPARAERARVAVSVAFAVNGLAFASWISRTPGIRDDLGLSTAGLGLLLLCLSAGAVAALPLSGPLVHRVGPARAVAIGSLAVTAGMLTIAAGTAGGSVPVAAVGMVLNGLGTSTWDVAQNVEGADVERRLGRILMPRLHAGFSLGTVAGAGLSAIAAALAVPVSAHLTVVALASGVTMLVAVRSFLPAQAAEVGERRPSGVLRAWREPRTLLIGLMVLAFAFTEGTANDWLAVALVDGYGTGEAVGAAGFGVFVAAMTAARMAGDRALARWGRVAVLRGTVSLALAGLLLVVFGAQAPAPLALGLALVGAVLWGAGASLGFPVGMSAAADDPTRAAVRVSVVSSIGYTAFLAGPPLIGFLGEAHGVLRALLVALAALVIGLAVAGAARPLTPPDAPDAPDASGAPGDQGSGAAARRRHAGHSP